jgi:putative transposase
MPRIARIVVPGQAHHVTQRGTRRMETFFCDEDYQEYLSLLGHWCGEFDVRIWSYCLMPNPVHLILVPQTAEGLWWTVSETHRRYTRRINFRERWRGHLWQGRFASFVMSENHLMGAARYVERNPVKADLVARAEGDQILDLSRSTPYRGLGKKIKIPISWLFFKELERFKLWLNPFNPFIGHVVATT